MGDMPHNRHGLIPMLVAMRVTAERKRREAESKGKGDDQAAPVGKPKKKKRGWFG
ncbi:hypothetical protein [Brevundimonas sp. UBA2416]|uniref:hypothetical protein n=1 Tax=Brevundimonas sp. UBA2416 TaxID=1946124 RepID=UPI0025C36A01|nr:hypothetical protein [Brevundimonas sp. UBA2416]HRJ65277.1 hypothetical protein [Brevundimonas sp.]